MRMEAAVAATGDLGAVAPSVEEEAAEGVAAASRPCDAILLDDGLAEGAAEPLEPPSSSDEEADAQAAGGGAAARALKNRRRKEKKQAKKAAEPPRSQEPDQEVAAAAAGCEPAANSAAGRAAAVRRLAAQRLEERQRQLEEDSCRRAEEEERLRREQEAREAEEAAERERRAKRKEKEKARKARQLAEEQAARRALALARLGIGAKLPASTGARATARGDDGGAATAGADVAHGGREALLAARAGGVVGKDGEDAETGGSDGASGAEESSVASAEPRSRSPVIAVLGHVDSGKTTFLDQIRRTKVARGEAGGITQQTAATFLPAAAVAARVGGAYPGFQLHAQGAFVIDTPGHEEFGDMRARGCGLSDVAILVVDITKGMEPQTLESLQLLKGRRFIIALNKVDRLFSWRGPEKAEPIRETLARQAEGVRDQFDKELSRVILQVNEQGLNCALYWQNEDPEAISIVPTSGRTGEGVPDILHACLTLAGRLDGGEQLHCAVLEVKHAEGQGAAVDAVLAGGTLEEGDRIVLAGAAGPIVTTIRGLSTAPALRETGEHVRHRRVGTSTVVRVCAPGLEAALPGSRLLVAGPQDDLEALRAQVMQSVAGRPAPTPPPPGPAAGVGACVRAASQGALDALLRELAKLKVPVSDAGVGDLLPKDVSRASLAKERGFPSLALIFAFGVKVNSKVVAQAKKDGVHILANKVIFHLLDEYKDYRAGYCAKKRAEAVFPAQLSIIDEAHVFRRSGPIIVGCTVVAGQLHLSTPLCVPSRSGLDLGRVVSIVRDERPVDVARQGDRVSVKIEAANSKLELGRDFDLTSVLCSKVTRASLHVLEEHFAAEADVGLARAICNEIEEAAC